MNTLNKVLIAVLVGQLALAVITLTRGDSGGIQALEPVVAGFAIDKVERIEIFKETDGGVDSNDDSAESGDQDSAGDVAIELIKSGDEWTVKSHYDYPADTSKIESLLSQVAGLQSRGPIATSAARQNQLAVADSKYQRKLVLHGAGEPVTLLVGDPAGALKTAVRRAGQDEIYAVTNFSMSSVSAFVSAWVDTAFMDRQPDELASLTVQNKAGTFTLERDGGQWKLASGAAGQPGAGDGAAAPADASAAGDKELDQSAIDGWARSVTKFNIAEPADPARAIDTPLATVTLRFKGDEPAGAGADDNAADGDGDSADADAGAADGADETSSSMSVVKDEETLTIGTEDDGKYYVRRASDSRSVWVYTSSIKPLVDLSDDTLYKKPDDGQDDPAGDVPAMPDFPGLAPGGGAIPLPPGQP